MIFTHEIYTAFVFVGWKIKQSITWWLYRNELHESSIWIQVDKNLYISTFIPKQRSILLAFKWNIFFVLAGHIGENVTCNHILIHTTNKLCLDGTNANLQPIH